MRGLSIICWHCDKVVTFGFRKCQQRCLYKSYTYGVPWHCDKFFLYLYTRCMSIERPFVSVCNTSSKHAGIYMFLYFTHVLDVKKDVTLSQFMLSLYNSSIYLLTICWHLVFALVTLSTVHAYYSYNLCSAESPAPCCFEAIFIQYFCDAAITFACLTKRRN